MKQNATVKKTIIGVLLVALMGLSVVLIMGGEKEGVVQAQAVPVETAYPVFEKITEWDEYSGRFEASNRVEVRARVSGFLQTVNFEAGQPVNKGDVLFVIDKRPFQIALDEAKATYAQMQSVLKTAKDNFDRVATLRESGAVSTEEYDRRMQALAQAEAGILAAQARVDNAKLNLDFTEVKAPISGLVSRDLVNEGNLIDGGSSNSTLLTTIVATSPIHFYFTGSESDYLKYVRLANNGEREGARSGGIPVQIKLLDEDKFAHKATMDFVDNEINNHSGTIEIRAVLENEDHFLEPGMFGKAQLLGSSAHEAIMVPDEIIGTNQSLRYIYILGEDNTVVSKTVDLGPLHSNGLRIIRGGITSKDKLIMSNIQKIRPGVAVTPTETSIEKGVNETSVAHLN